MKKIIAVLLVLVITCTVFAGDVSVSTEGFVDYPDSWSNLSKDEITLKLVNLLSGISTQKGLTYISRMAGYKPKTLFEESYCISDIERKRSRIEDPVFSSVPDTFTIYAYQQDNRFGGNTFVLDYTVEDSCITLEIVNHTAMKFSGITCVKPEALTMTLKIFQEENGMKITADALAKNQKAEVNLVFYKVDLESSFNRRITALQNWFIDQVSKF